MEFTEGNGTRARNKMGKQKIKRSLCTDDMTGYRENPKESTSQLLELISKFGKVAGYKVNM